MLVPKTTGDGHQNECMRILPEGERTGSGAAKEQSGGI